MYAHAATPTLHGQSGYINMPSASVEADGTFSVGYGYDDPYGSFWASSTILPFLQVTGRFVSISGIPGFTWDPDAYGGQYGRYKDKVVDVKARLWEESGWRPSVALGITDVQGTGLFRGYYAVATKTFGEHRNLEASLGYGRDRPDGAYVGLRWTPTSMPRWSLVAEYDANDYSSDFRASETFAGKRSKGPAVGVEYRWGWLGVQAAKHREHASINAFVSIPFSEREFVPKFQEPAYYNENPPRPRPTLEEWHHDSSHASAMLNALASQDYKNVRAQVKGHVLYLQLTNSRISNLGRAVGRAARIALAFAPQELRGIHITYTTLEQPIATYEFFDLKKLADYFEGRIDRKAFLETVLVRYANASDVVSEDEEGMLVGVNDSTGLSLLVNHEGDLVQVASEDSEANKLKIHPKFSFFFNDPSGAFRYEIALLGSYRKRLGQGLYLDSDLGMKVYETVSGVRQPSNSLLPHVRTDVAEYKRGSRVKLYRLLLNKYWMPAERWYARASAGIYEEMYRGFGGQVLYLPRTSRWAADLAVDALQQRDYKGWFGARDYNVVTAIGSLHYRMTRDITVTARAGRFLAKDWGVRGEFKRRFRSGIELGAWYTITDGNDVTSPGAPGNPYYDKGVFISIPLSSMLTMDSQATASFALAPWTRDVGQMVASPGDLYDMLEGPRRELHLFDGLGNFGERADEVDHPAVNPPDDRLRSPWPILRMRLEQSTSALPEVPDFVANATLAAGAVAVSTLFDKPADRIAREHLGSKVRDGMDKVGKLAPLALVGAAGLATALGDDRMSNIGLISLQAVGIALGTSMGAKYAIGRARPEEGRGVFARSAKKSDAAFPSNHASVAFAAVTPFAKEYDAPWLYGVAAMASAGRVAARKHWVSDVVAGGLLGYATGSWLWNAQRDPSKGRLSLTADQGEVALIWETTY